MKTRPTSQIFISLVWGVPILLVLPLYLGFRISFWLDQTLNLTQPIPVPVNLILGLILWLIFLPIYFLAAFYLIKYGRGSPNPYHASPPNLVTTGPYRYIRHPMNLSYPFLILGVTLFLNSFSAIFILTPVSALVFWFHALVLQERELTKNFGKKYQDYKKKTPTFLPKFGKYSFLLVITSYFLP